MPKISQKAEEKKELPHSVRADVYDLTGKPSGKMILPEEIFGVKADPKLLTQVIHVFRSNQRLGTHSSKTRTMVSGSTRKIYRQKGTGRARHGDIKAPIFIGGGVAHGPHPKDYSLNIPQTMKRKSLFAALSGKLSEGALKIIEGISTLEPKTKILAKTLLNFGINNKSTNTLIISGKDGRNIYLAGRNLRNVRVLSGSLINTYEILSPRNILLAREGVELIKKTFFGGNEEKTHPRAEKAIPDKNPAKPPVKKKTEKSKTVKKKSN